MEARNTVTNVLNSKAFRWTLIALAVGLAGFILFHVTGAGAYFYEDEYAFRWHTSSATACDDNTQWDSEFEDGVEDYDDNTVLSIDFVSCSDDHDIESRQHNWGASGWIGFAFTSTDDDPCWAWSWTGNCDDGNNKADFAYVMWNTYSGYTIDAPEWQALHELGHVFAMRHPEDEECDNPEPSVMQVPLNFEGDCDTYYATLKTYDIDQIEQEYD